jgi:integrase
MLEPTRSQELIVAQDIPPRSLPDMLNAWIDAKMKKSGSAKTKEAYLTVMQSFRVALAGHEIDLDGPPRLIAEIAQHWSTLSQAGGVASNSTVNQRLAIISSFYRYALKMYRDEATITENPIERTERPSNNAYEHSEAIAHDVLDEILKGVDKSTLQGKQYYALLSVAINTGRRVSEVRAMCWGHLTVRQSKVTVLFPRTKRGKEMKDQLSPKTSKALMEYLHGWYGSNLAQLSSDAPIWVTLDDNQYHGNQMSVRTMQRICGRLCEGNFHKLRASFAVTMEEAGAKVSEIQARLGHESLATTGRYLAALHKAENPYGTEMEKLYGME